jgi:hypothetical protein
MSALGALGEVESDSDIGRSDEELRSVIGHEGSVTSTLVLGQDLPNQTPSCSYHLSELSSGAHIDLSLELLVRLDGARGN